MSATPLGSEPLLEMEDIQGNILAGFNKDHQAFIFVGVDDAGAAGEAARVWAKEWVSRMEPDIATAGEVHRFNKLFRAMRARRGADPAGLVATWVNIAFTVSGVRKLVSPEDAALFEDPYFAEGMRNDPPPSMADPIAPSQSAHPGHVDRWLFGGTRTAVDIMVIVASDSDFELRAAVDRIELSLNAGGPAGALQRVHTQWGHTLPPPLTGHEHFGFKDGVSQPGVRGRIAEDVPLTRRLIDPEEPQQMDDLRPELSRPGQPLIWPGQFIFGYPRQSEKDRRTPVTILEEGAPDWARNGSYLVCRRLRQDVGAFDRFVAKGAADLATREPALASLRPEQFAALLVGRWPSGAPIMRAPATGADVPDLGTNDLAHNHFRFNGSTAPLRLIPEVAGMEGAFPQAPGDPLGRRCPFSSHIRKVNPRDKTTEKGSEADTLARLVLRRGIPFGDPLPDRSRPDEDPLDGDRGLMFVCYQTSILEQFAVLNAEWANSDTRPAAGGGHDPIIGQTNEFGSRDRFFMIELPGGGSATIPLPEEWVIMTGGDYFFSPGIRALREVFGTGAARSLTRVPGEEPAASV